MDTISYKMNLKNTLRNHLLGKENLEIKNRLLNELNITESALKRWLSLSDTNAPQIDALPVICNILNISLYDLFGIPNPTASLSDEELKLLEEYRKQENMQQAVKNVLNIK